MKQILIIFLVSFCLSSCYTKKGAIARFCKTSSVQQDSVVKKDSVSITDIHLVRDSIIIVPEAILQTTIANPCDSFFFNQKIKSGSASLQVKKTPEGIQIECRCDSVLSHYRNEVRKRDSLIYAQEIHRQKSETVMAPESETYPWWKGPAFLLALIFLIILLFKYGKK